jgi:hypothetical protein
MLNEMQVLIITAISVACLHTLTGPDHYLPFIALSKARGWSAGKTIGWTILCGSGHVFSSVLLGLGGAALGWSLSKLSWLENIRGGIAGWVMLCFGLLYGGWGLYRALKNIPHKHFESGENNDLYVYVLLIAVYTVFTLLTMLTMVLIGYYGTGFVKGGKSERYVHFLGGLTIFICGTGMVFLEW